MKKFLCLLMAVAVLPLFAADLSDDETRQVVYDALKQARTALKSAPFGKKTVAVLPLRGDNAGLFTGKLKNQLTELGFVCVEGKEDPMWNEIIKEVAWDERKDDILDRATLVKFGKLKAAQILLYGRIAALDRNSVRIYAEIELHATDLATKQHIWGGTFAARVYRDREVRGIITLDNELRMLLKKSFGAARESLLSSETEGKLGSVKNAIVIPLAGDIDGYMTGLAIEALTETPHQPKRPQIPSLSLLRTFAKAGAGPGDAVFYGAVRDLRRTEPKKEVRPGKRIRSTYDIHADIQLFLEDLKSGSILWSKTITLKESVSGERPMTADEVAEFRRAKIDAAPAAIKEDLIDNWKHYLAVAGGVIGVLVLILAIIIGIKAFVSYHDVR